MTALCRDCFTLSDAPEAARCRACKSPRLLRHPELAELSIAHIDCDAFYAAVEKRDNPALADKPLIVGGGKRGVVSTCCYIARTFGIKSAMPMFKALQACPHAVVVFPDMPKYVAVSRDVKKLMLETTPMVEPLSLDEAFLDLTGTERLHRMKPAQTLARLAKRVEQEIGITFSVGLSFNKFLAKVASDIDWMIRILKNGDHTLNTHLILSRFKSGGVSQKNIRHGLKERFRIMVHFYGFSRTAFNHLFIGTKFFFYYLRHRRI